MEFKVGDRVRISVSCMGNDGKEGVISEVDGSVIPYNVTLDDGGTEWKHPDNITKLEETRMKFKVGDKVKVSDSWFGHGGQVGVIERIDHMEPYNYGVKFDVEGYNERYNEPFREDSLELVSEKQSFTKSDLKTGMGVVLRNGSRAHVLLGTDDGDVIRFLAEGGKWGRLSELDEQLYDKDGNQFDIVEVYSTTFSNLYMTDKVFDEKLVFKREEPKPEPIKMTMKEINEHFGKVIEIIE